MHYILKDGEVVVADLMTWARFMDNISARIVVNTDVNGANVSTVFLGLDHNYSGTGPPVLWETMIFGGEHGGNCERYTSAEDARRHHDQIVEALRAGKEPPELAPSTTQPTN